MQFMGYWFMVVLPYAAQRSVINASTTLNISTNICIIKHNISAKSNIYSFGVVLLKLIRVPIHRPSHSE
jgi:hypothetical protein